MKFNLGGISFTIGGEDPMNAKLDRYNELSKDAETETYEEWIESPNVYERLELRIELEAKGIIQMVDEPEPTRWQKFWGK